MVTSLSNGLTIIENTEGWADPDDIDLDNYTFGTDYVHVLLDERVRPEEAVDIHHQKFPGGIHVVTPLAEMDRSFMITGILIPQTLATRNLITQFAALHTRISDEILYIILKRGSEYYEFADPRRVMREYAPGALVSLIAWEDIKKQQFRVDGLFQIAWSR